MSYSLFLGVYLGFQYNTFHYTILLLFNLPVKLIIIGIGKQLIKLIKTKFK